VLFLVDSCIPARQWTDICNTRCSILSRFSHFNVSHFQRPRMDSHLCVVDNYTGCIVLADTLRYTGSTSASCVCDTVAAAAAFSRVTLSCRFERKMSPFLGVGVPKPFAAGPLDRNSRKQAHPWDVDQCRSKWAKGGAVSGGKTTRFRPRFGAVRRNACMRRFAAVRGKLGGNIV